MTHERFYLNTGRYSIAREGDRWLKTSKTYVAIARTSSRNLTRSSLIAMRLNMRDSDMGCR
jgi:hypothetical protein